VIQAGFARISRAFPVSNKPDVLHCLPFLRTRYSILHDRDHSLAYRPKGLGMPEGIVPLLDSYIPENPKRGRPWYVMPLAVPYLETIEQKNPFEIATEFQTLAETLNRLHGQGISHRDIKPANFLVLDGQICLSDFGLVKLPNAEGLTPERRDVGAKYTIAPEMRRAPIEADGQLADIYSLAKSLWMVLTRRALGFDGQYEMNSFSSVHLKPFRLLALATLRKNSSIEARDYCKMPLFVNLLWSSRFAIRDTYMMAYYFK